MEGEGEGIGLPLLQRRIYRVHVFFFYRLVLYLFYFQLS